MAAPTPVSVGTYLAAASATTAAVAVPAGAQANDVVLAHLWKVSAAAVTPPAGFTECTNSPISTVTNGVHSQHVFWKRLTGSDSGTYSFSWTGSTTREGVACLYRGCVTTGDPTEINNAAQDSSSTAPTPAVSGTTGGADRLLTIGFTKFNTGTLTPPTGFTLNSTSTGTERVVTATMVKASAGATGSLSGSWSTASRQTAFLIALVPVAGSAVALDGIASSSSGASGGMARDISMGSQSVAAAALTGSAGIDRGVLGSVIAAADASGDTQLARALSAAVEAASSSSGDITLDQALAGVLAAACAASGTPGVDRALAVFIAAASSAGGTLTMTSESPIGVHVLSPVLSQHARVFRPVLLSVPGGRRPDVNQTAPRVTRPNG